MQEEEEDVDEEKVEEEVEEAEVVKEEEVWEDEEEEEGETVDEKDRRDATYGYAKEEQEEDEEEEKEEDEPFCTAAEMAAVPWRQKMRLSLIVLMFSSLLPSLLQCKRNKISIYLCFCSVILA